MTNKERVNIDTYLRAQNDLWVGRPDFGTFSEELSQARMKDLRDAIIKETDADPHRVEAAYEKSSELIDEIYQNFYGDNDTIDVGRVFMVTRRAHMSDGDEYESESRYHFPLATSEFNVSPEMRMRSQFGLPPFVADTYTHSDSRNERGALVIAPLYQDMNTEIHDETERMLLGYNALQASVEFSQRKLGASVIGLGALLPQITRFGSLLKNIDGAAERVTTTGHGGTVHLITKTVEKVLEQESMRTKFNGAIGVIGGAGSICWSSMMAIREMTSDVRFYACDTRPEKLYERLENDVGGGKDITTAHNLVDVLQNTDVIVSAITEVIDLDQQEREAGHAIDLRGKVIIDDSQPGCFHRQQVEDRGGTLVWIVGKDGSDSQFMTRDGRYTGGVGYNYGDKAGLWGPDAEFGCGIEAAVIAQSGEYDKAIQAPVTPDDVKKIGALFDAAGATVADFQSFGQPVEID